MGPHANGTDRPNITRTTHEVIKMTFAKRVESYICENYDIPSGMLFYHGVLELEFDDWIEECIDVLNENVIEPYGESSDYYRTFTAAWWC